LNINIIQSVGLRSSLSNVKDKQYGGTYDPFLGEPKKGDLLKKDVCRSNIILCAVRREKSPVGGVSPGSQNPS
jgi:hypothetical protein